MSYEWPQEKNRGFRPLDGGYIEETGVLIAANGPQMASDGPDMAADVDGTGGLQLTHPHAAKAA